MKIEICDICKQPIRLSQRQYKIRIKKEVFHLTGSWFEKMDICEDCADKIIYECRKKEADEEEE